MNFQAKPREKRNFLVLQIINLSDGKKSLLDICNEKKFKLIYFLDVYKELIKVKLIKKK